MGVPLEGQTLSSAGECVRGSAADPGEEEEEERMSGNISLASRRCSPLERCQTAPSVGR